MTVYEFGTALVADAFAVRCCRRPQRGASRLAPGAAAGAVGAGHDLGALHGVPITIKDWVRADATRPHTGRVVCRSSDDHVRSGRHALTGRHRAHVSRSGGYPSYEALKTPEWSSTDAACSPVSARRIVVVTQCDSTRRLWPTASTSRSSR